MTLAKTPGGTLDAASGDSTSAWGNGMSLSNAIENAVESGIENAGAEVDLNVAAVPERRHVLDLDADRTRLIHSILRALGS